MASSIGTTRANLACDYDFFAYADELAQAGFGSPIVSGLAASQIDKIPAPSMSGPCCARFVRLPKRPVRSNNPMRSCVARSRGCAMSSNKATATCPRAWLKTAAFELTWTAFSKVCPAVCSWWKTMDKSPGRIRKLCACSE